MAEDGTRQTAGDGSQQQQQPQALGHAQKAHVAFNAGDFKADARDHGVVDMYEDTPLVAPPPYFVRYFPRVAYLCDAKNIRGNDIGVRVHSNRLCVIFLAHGHFLLEREPTADAAHDDGRLTPLKREIVGIDFAPQGGVDRLANAPRGKRKRGTQWLNQMSKLANITYKTRSSSQHCDASVVDQDQKEVFLCSPIRASLLEVNEQLIRHPDLLQEHPDIEGYIAIVNPKLSEEATVLSSLLTEEQYKEHLSKRRESGLPLGVDTRPPREEENAAAPQSTSVQAAVAPRVQSSNAEASQPQIQASGDTTPC